MAYRNFLMGETEGESGSCSDEQGHLGKSLIQFSSIFFLPSIFYPQLGIKPRSLASQVDSLSSEPHGKS